MTDQPRQEDPSLASFGRYLLGGGVLGLGVGASWEVMSWLWMPGQFSPLRLLSWGTWLGLGCGFVIWLTRAPNRSRRTVIAEGDGPRPTVSSSVPTDWVSRAKRVGHQWRPLAEIAVWGLVSIALIAPIWNLHWKSREAQQVFAALTTWVLLCVVTAALMWLLVLLVGNSKHVPTSKSTENVPTSKGADPIGPGKTAGGPPALFENRLAAFLHCSEQELLRPRPRPPSKMPFWSVVDLRSYVGPKPVWIIRRILERIRATVRGSIHR